MSGQFLLCVTARGNSSPMSEYPTTDIWGNLPNAGQTVAMKPDAIQKRLKLFFDHSMDIMLSKQPRKGRCRKLQSFIPLASSVSDGCDNYNANSGRDSV